LFLLIFATKTVKRRKRRKFHEKEEMKEAFSEKGGKGGAFTSQASTKNGGPFFVCVLPTSILLIKSKRVDS
jgi:hypothetical protein